MISVRLLKVFPPKALRGAALDWLCCKRLMVPPEVLSLLAMGRLMGESRDSTDDAAMDKARMRVVNRDTAGNMIDWY
jgi:hypothetical protein